MFRNAILGFGLFVAAMSVSAQEVQPVYGKIMQGFPPPKEQRVTTANFMLAPYNRWAFMRSRELHPNREIYRGNKPVTELPASPLDLDSLEFKLIDDRTVKLAEWLDYSMTDSFIVLHKGSVVYEYYVEGMAAHRQHNMFSVTKSIVATLVLTLMEEGLIDAGRSVVSYIPELAGSAFADSTVQQVLDMTTSVSFSEEYNDPEAGFWDYAGVFGIGPAERRTYTSIYAYLPTLKKGEYPHGEGFVYITPKTDVLGWLLSRVTGKRVSQLVEERFWQPMGMERDAYMWLDGEGGEFAGGGLSLTARDSARFGQMILQGGRYNEEQIIPESVARRILTPGDPKLFTRFHEDPWYSEIGHSYHDQWWSFNNAHQAVSGLGVHGQFIYMDPVAEMVVVKQSSHPEEESDANDTDGPIIWQQIAEYLLSKSDAERAGSADS